MIFNYGYSGPLERAWKAKYWLFTFLVGIILLPLLSNFATDEFAVTPSLPQSKVASVTPIQHIVIIIQENHAFDNFFGVYPGVPNGYGLNLEACLPAKRGPCVTPWDADNNSNVQATDIPHTSAAGQHDYDGGKMDGFVTELATSIQNYTMAYYTNKTIPTYWDYAEEYTLNDVFMASALSMSLPNHLYAVAASDGCTSLVCPQNTGPTNYNLTFPQIAEYLTPLGITWGYYQYNWNDTIDCQGPYTAKFVNSHFPDGDSYWTGLADFTQVTTTPVECTSLGNFNDLQNAIADNDLPNVSWVIPEPQGSDHPGQSTLADGQAYIASIINSIEESPAWLHTVIFLTWDEWGGYYDGIVPFQVDTQGQGFRVPLLAISPYSIQDTVLHGPTYKVSSGSMKGNETDQEDFSAFISTIEYNWDLKAHNSFYKKDGLQTLPLNERDKDQPNLFYMLNFSQTPLEPFILSTSGNVLYPISACLAADSCNYAPIALPYGGPSVVNFFKPSNSSFTESLEEALNYSGTGDPYD